MRTANATYLNMHESAIQCVCHENPSLHDMLCLQAAAPDVPELPPEVLRYLLQHVELKQRLGTCALVSRAWKTAAVAATISMAVTVTSNSCNSLAMWLNSNGSGLQFLSIARRRESANSKQGPCHMLLALSRLQQLRSLRMSLIDIAPSTSATRAAAGNTAAEMQSQQYLLDNALGLLTALTSLLLLDGAADLRQLYKCTELQRLELTAAEHKRGPNTAANELELREAIKAALQQLTQLTQLTLISPAEQQLPALEPQLFDNLTQLRALWLEGYNVVLGSTLASTSLSGLTRLKLFGVVQEPGGAAALFRSIGQLQQLQHLNLDRMLHVAINEVDPQHLPYLTASDHLTHLSLQRCMFSEDAWEYVFPAERQLFQLRSLCVMDRLCQTHASFRGWSAAAQICSAYLYQRIKVGAGVFVQSLCIHSTALKRVPTCCN